MHFPKAGGEGWLCLLLFSEARVEDALCCPARETSSCFLWLDGRELCDCSLPEAKEVSVSNRLKAAAFSSGSFPPA